MHNVPVIVIDSWEDNFLEFAQGFSHDVNIMYVEEDQIYVLVDFVVFVSATFRLIGNGVYRRSDKKN